MKKVDIRALTAWLDATLQAARFKDYAPNGLQVEGKAEVAHIITGVTASEALLRAAVERGADAVLVHHGWFWRNEDPRVLGPRRRRLALALAHDLNLIGYHLPLDAHPTLGNNAQLARVLGLEPARDTEGAPLTCGRDGLIWLGTAPAWPRWATWPRRSASAWAANLVGGRSRRAGGPRRLVHGWRAGHDGRSRRCRRHRLPHRRSSEPNTHLARETGVGFISAGHHATERYGVQALGAAVAAQFGIKVEFVDIDNPV